VHFEPVCSPITELEKGVYEHENDLEMKPTGRGTTARTNRDAVRSKSWDHELQEALTAWASSGDSSFPGLSAVGDDSVCFDGGGADLVQAQSYRTSLFPRCMDCEHVIRSVFWLVILADPSCFSRTNPVLAILPCWSGRGGRSGGLNAAVVELFNESANIIGAAVLRCDGRLPSDRAWR